jgi:hypothetical protein
MITRRRSSNTNRRASKKRTSSKNEKYGDLGVGETIDINEPVSRKSPQSSKKNKKDKDVKISVIKKDDIEKYSHQIKIDLNENSENKMIIKNFNNSINKDKYRISPIINNQNNKPIYRESPSLLQNYNNQINNLYKRQPNLVENNLLRNSPIYSPNNNQLPRYSPIKSNEKEYTNQILSNVSSDYVNNDLRRYSPTYIKDYSKSSPTYIKDSKNNFEYSKPKQSPKLIDYDVELGIKGRFKEYRESPSLLNNSKSKSPFIDYSKKENEIINRNLTQSPRRYIDLTNNNFRVSPTNNRNEYRESPSFLRYNNILDNNKNMSNINKNTENKKHSPQLRNNKIENKNQNSPILQSQKNIPTLKQFQNTLKDSNNEILALSEKSVPILTNLDNFILPKSHFKESLFLKNKEQITYFKNMPDISDKYICTIISEGIKINKQELDNKT